jgi:hypothetical protein
LLNAVCSFQEKALHKQTVPKTDSGGLVEYTKALWENHVEGTRQNDSVTSGERVLILGQPKISDTKQGVATVY